MIATTKFVIGAALSGAALAMTGAGTAAAQPADESVNVMVDAVTIQEHASPEDAAQTAAAICAQSTAQITALARTVNTTGAPQTVCNVPGGSVVLTKYGQTEGNVPVHPPAGAQPAPPPAPGR
ncbi:hypothetical protein [Mycobacterium kyogaense]|uniref:hypothetical protein n=1 Tax=Mycobacterium kyogaense TaxID=2212479 RepID=UPI000DAB9437|nr:hypothetical protein [Mycobacterium kyogaense]